MLAFGNAVYTRGKTKIQKKITEYTKSALKIAKNAQLRIINLRNLLPFVITKFCCCFLTV